jgi:hypothetical protein
MKNTPIGKNILATLIGTKLTLEVDLSKEFGPSKSGKTTVIASTNGNKSIIGSDAVIGLNVYK